MMIDALVIVKACVNSIQQRGVDVGSLVRP
jgi:hypothetical protein